MTKFERIISETTQPATRQSLLADLRQLGIAHGDTLMVHTSLSKLGYIVDGKQSLLQALIDSVGEAGTILMPAQTGSNSDPENWSMPPIPQDWWQTVRDNIPAFDKHTSPSDVGAVAEAFRAYPNTLRSDHPQVSFCARGALAQELTRTHVLTPKFGHDTPLGKLYQLGAKILMLGTDYDTVTALHLSEVESGRSSVSQDAAAMFVNGERVWQVFNDYDYDTDDFVAIGQAYEAEHTVVSGKVGMGVAKVLDMRSIVDFATVYMKEHPLAVQ